MRCRNKALLERLWRPAKQRTDIAGVDRRRYRQTTWHDAIQRSIRKRTSRCLHL